MSKVFSIADNVHVAHHPVKHNLPVETHTDSDHNAHMDKFDDRPDTARRLQQAREIAGFKTAKDAAKRFGWAYYGYAQHENGTRGLNQSSKKYAKAFKVSEGWLLTGEGPGPGSREVNLQKKLQILPQEDYDEVMAELDAYTDVIIKNRLERRR